MRLRNIEHKIDSGRDYFELTFVTAVTKEEFIKIVQKLQLGSINFTVT